MESCMICDDPHYFVVSYSSTSEAALEELINMNAEAMDLLEQNIIQYEGIVERCEHCDVQDCEDCDFIGG